MEASAIVLERLAIPLIVKLCILMVDSFFVRLVENPTAWELELKHDNPRRDGEHDREQDDSENEGELHTEKQSQPQIDSLPRHTAAYSEFLQFLELGCSGSPTQGYPTIVVILSTIPSSVRPLSTFP